MIVVPQIMAALVVGLCYYMLAVAMTVYDGLLSMIFQPIMGLVFCGIAILILLILGLPIRLSTKINAWWKSHWWIPILIGTVAFIMMALSWSPAFRVNVMGPELQTAVESFHPVLATGGWLLTLFAVLHFYPPIPWISRDCRPL